MTTIPWCVGCGDSDPPTSPAPAPAVVAEAGSTRPVSRGRLKFVDNLPQGRERARVEGKPLLLFFTAEWCHLCHQMADEAFVDEQLVQLADRFVCVLIDADLAPDVCEEFGVRYYPTMQFLSAQGAPLQRVTGKKPAYQLVMEMQSALTTVARRADGEAIRR